MQADRTKVRAVRPGKDVPFASLWRRRSRPRPVIALRVYSRFYFPFLKTG